jgi:hypothetical protein
VGIALEDLALQSDRLQQLPDAFLPLRLRADAVDVKRLADDVPDGETRIERGVGVLEDHLDLAAQSEELGLAAAHEVLAPVQDAPRRRLLEPDDRPAEGRLAAAALPDQTEGSARPEREGDPLHRHDVPTLAREDSAPDRVELLEVLDLEDGPAVAAGNGRRARRAQLGFSRGK